MFQNPAAMSFTKNTRYKNKNNATRLVNPKKNE